MFGDQPKRPSSSWCIPHELQLLSRLHDWKIIESICHPVGTIYMPQHNPAELAEALLEPLCERWLEAASMVLPIIQPNIQP